MQFRAKCPARNCLGTQIIGCRLKAVLADSSKDEALGGEICKLAQKNLIPAESAVFRTVGPPVSGQSSGRVKKLWGILGVPHYGTQAESTSPLFSPLNPLFLERIFSIGFVAERTI
jgi:hypothetical protein